MTNRPLPPERSSITIRSPVAPFDAKLVTLARTSIALSALIARSTSSTVVAAVRSISADAPERSVMVIVPRRTPAPPLSSSSGVPRFTRARANSTVRSPRPTGVESASANPRLIMAWEETRE